MVSACSCSILVCKCGYPSWLAQLAVAVGVLFLIWLIFAVFQENYCGYENMEQCKEKYYDTCQKEADNTPWYPSYITRNSCLCRECEKCAKKDSNEASSGMVCRVLETTMKNTNNKVVTDKVEQTVRKGLSKFGLEKAFFD